MKNTLEFYISKRQILTLILFGIALVLLGLFCIKSPSSVISSIGCITILIGVIGIMIGGYHFVIRNPRLILSDRGVEDKRITKKIILWDEITTAVITEEKGQKSLQVKFKTGVKRDRFKLLYRISGKKNLENNTVKFNLDILQVDYQLLNAFLMQNKI
jgi:predicted membrane channel-forming protein YqfA (hemolysin III family)